MLYKFYPKFICNYSQEDVLIYGQFYGERPAWHIVRDMENWRIELLEKIPMKDDQCNDKSKLIYRVRGREGNTTRFYHSKIRRMAVPYSGDKYVMAIREDLIPD